MIQNHRWNMLQREHELLDLSAADAHLLDGRERIRRQIELVRQLRAGGNDTAFALRLLDLLRASVALERDHRMLILARLAELERRLR